MGAGHHPAGAGPAGHSPVAAPSAAPPRQVGAVFYDPATQGVHVLADGTLQGCHSVDQAAALAFFLMFGDVGSLPEEGQRLTEIEHLGPGYQATAEDRVRLAWARLVRDRDIQILGIVVEPIAKGVVISASYENLRLPGASKPRTVQAKIGA